jgi:large subunit ribosomal protein L29
MGKILKASELRELDRESLKRKIDELRRELLITRIAHSTQQLKNPLKLRVLRREVARTLTILKEKGAS